MMIWQGPDIQTHFRVLIGPAMLRAQGPTRALRSSSVKHYIGCPRSDLPAGKLPSIQDVLRVQAWCREQPKCSNQRVVNMCCSINTSTRESDCFKEGGCRSESGGEGGGEACLTFKVKTPYLKAGIVTVTDRTIVDHLVKTNDEYTNMKKYIGRESESAKLKRDEYVAKIAKTFHIIDPNARRAIENDPKRDQKAKEEDLKYFDDYFGEGATRRMTFASRDKHYDAAVEEADAKRRRRLEREERQEQLRSREENRLAQESNSSAIGVEEHGEMAIRVLENVKQPHDPKPTKFCLKNV